MVETVQFFEEKINHFAESTKTLNTIFNDETKVLNRVISNLSQEKLEADKLAKMFRFQLKTPRQHLEFLKKAGKLDDFVEAKQQGKDEVAKWHLLDMAQDEISKIQTSHRSVVS